MKQAGHIDLRFEGVKPSRLLRNHEALKWDSLHLYESHVISRATTTILNGGAIPGKPGQSPRAHLATRRDAALEANLIWLKVWAALAKCSLLGSQNHKGDSNGQVGHWRTHSIEIELRIKQRLVKLDTDIASSKRIK
jgi:hypothetical protein